MRLEEHAVDTGYWIRCLRCATKDSEPLNAP